MVIKEMYRIMKFVCSINFVRMSVLWTLSLAISYLRLFFTGRLWGQKCSVYCRQKVTAISDSQRPVCMVTGATSGLGAAAALALSKEGFFVILVGRSGYSLSKTMAEIRKLNENAQLEAFEVDLSSFSSIMKLKDLINQWLFDMNLHPSIQLLINNAGLLATSYRATTHGFDEMMMTNYMGAFSLTQLLLPLLFNSPVPSRVVNVSSFTHRNVNGIQVDKEFVCGKSISNTKQYPFARLYEYSKLYVLLFSYKLHRHIISMDKASQLSVNVADPGAVKTKIMREIPSCLSQLAFSVLNLMQLLQSPEEGVSSILDASLAPPSTEDKCPIESNSDDLKGNTESASYARSNKDSATITLLQLLLSNDPHSSHNILKYQINLQNLLYFCGSYLRPTNLTSYLARPRWLLDKSNTYSSTSNLFREKGISGMYFFSGNGRTMNSSLLSYDAKVAEKLWETSCHLFSELKCSYEKIATCD